MDEWPFGISENAIINEFWSVRNAKSSNNSASFSLHQENIQVNFGNFDFENMNFGNSNFQNRNFG